MSKSKTTTLNLTDEQKQYLIDLTYQEAKKWYEYIVDEGTRNSAAQVDIINAIDLHLTYSKIFYQLTDRDWIEEYKLMDILCIE